VSYWAASPTFTGANRRPPVEREADATSRCAERLKRVLSEGPKLAHDFPGVVFFLGIGNPLHRGLVSFIGRLLFCLVGILLLGVLLGFTALATFAAAEAACVLSESPLASKAMVIAATRTLITAAPPFLMVNPDF